MCTRQRRPTGGRGCLPKGQGGRQLLLQSWQAVLVYAGSKFAWLYRGRLTEDVDCFELMDALCDALHQEFLEVFRAAIPELDAVSLLQIPVTVTSRLE